VELLKVAAATHYRLSSVVDPVSYSTTPIANNAKDLKLNVKFTEEVSADTYKGVIKDAINRRYDLSEGSPLWHADIVGPACMRGEGYVLPVDQEEATARGVEIDPHFFVFFSFNHCLGDGMLFSKSGLSMLAISRTYFSLLNAEAFNREPISLESVAVTQDPPPLLDNMIKTSFFGILSRIELLIQRR
jgi:hypothetical protein